MKLRERDLEDLLFHHPYLIDEIFADLAPRKVRRQIGCAHNRLDLLFDLPVGLCIAELKVTRLRATDVRQLIRYCAEWSRTETLAPSHFLIGKRPANDHEILEAIADCKFEIKLRYLGVDLPAQLTFDEEARRYRVLQARDAAQHVLELHF